MPYHVQLQVGGDDREILLDLARSELDRRILEPYRLGRTVVAGGKLVNPREIRLLKITYSDRSSDETIRELEGREFASGAPALDHRSLLRNVAEDGRDVTDQLISDVVGYGEANRRSVFLVRGRWDKAAEAMRAFLESLGLTVVEWPEAKLATGKGTPYTADILATGFAMAHVVIVFLTPDDIVALHPALERRYKKTEEFSGQARPNVIFEAGMAWYRNRDRTIIVEYGALRSLSDLSGISRETFDGSPESRHALFQRLQSLGAEVTASAGNWLKQPRFPAKLPTPTYQSLAQKLGNQPPPSSTLLSGIPLRWVLLGQIAASANTRQVLDLDVIATQTLRDLGEVRTTLDRLIHDGLAVTNGSGWDRTSTRVACDLTEAGRRILEAQQ